MQMLNRKIIILLSQLILGLSVLIFHPTLSQSQDVTITIGDSSGFVGSECCNPNYPTYNKVEVSLSNPSNTVSYLWVNIEDVDDYLEASGCDTTGRTEGFICYFTELASGKGKLVLTGGEIATGSGPIATLKYDVKEEAPGGGADRDLYQEVIQIEDGTGSPLTADDTDSGKFYFYDCSSNDECDEGEECRDGYCGWKLGYDNGVSEFNLNATLRGLTSGARAVVMLYTLDSGSWDGGDAAGALYLDDVSGTFVDNETIIDSKNPAGLAKANGTTLDQYCRYRNASYCDDGLFCNGDDICFLGECQHAGDPCSLQLLCDEDNDRCYCDADAQCDDGDFCNGEESCVIGTGVCQDNEDPCSDPTPYCEELEEMCYPYDNVSVDIASGSGTIGSTNKTVPVALANPVDTIRGIQMKVCDQDNDLTCTACEAIGRAAGFSDCDVTELTDGCCDITLFDQHDPYLTITPGSGTILNIKYDVKEVSEGASTGLKYLILESALMQDVDDPPNNLRAELYDGVFQIYCSTDEDCSDGLFCTGVEKCIGDPPSNTECLPGQTDFDPPAPPPSGYPCPAYYCCDEDSDTCTEQIPQVDYDCDGLIDEEDNCPEHHNGPFIGTCVITKSGMVVSYRVEGHFITCFSDNDCAATTGATCQMSQGDCNGNGCGDVCECLLDCNKDGVGDGKVTGSDLGVLKGEYGRWDCSELDPCYADGNKDGKVTGSDLGLLKNEYGRWDCPACP